MREPISIDGIFLHNPEVKQLEDLIVWANKQIEKHKELIKQCKTIIKEKRSKNQTTIYDIIGNQNENT